MVGVVLGTKSPLWSRGQVGWGQLGFVDKCSGSLVCVGGTASSPMRGLYLGSVNAPGLLSW